MINARSIIGLLVIYGILNLALWGGQELYYLDETKEINKIENYLESEKTTITLLQKQIQNQSLGLEQKEHELKNLERRGLIDIYNNNVNIYNSLLVDYKNNLNDYENKITQYNNEINRVNELIKKSSSRWYLIPIPLPGKSTKSKL